MICIVIKKNFNKLCELLLFFDCFMVEYLKMHFQKECPQMADEIVYKKMARKADKGLEGKVVAKHGKQTSQKL